MMEVRDVRKAVLAAIEKALTTEELETIRIQYLGRKGKLTAVLRSLKDLPLAERRRIGPRAQALKREIESLLGNLKTSAKGGSASGGKSSVDLTAPGRKQERGHLHLLTQIDRDIRKIFLSMNFSVVEGPEVETEYYNFDVLNIPADHPARDLWDTFWLKTRIGADQNADRRGNNIRENQRKHPRGSALLLRTHTSPVQIRYMEKHNPPFQIIVPGRVFRYEAIDATHEVNFYQLEGLMVGRDVTLANFKFVIEEFFRKFFGGKIEFRYRPSYFPFVEPGLEVDIKIKNKWLEVMGAGMVHPRVFEYAHYNPRDLQGFAFGVGIDRLAMIKYKIPDVRLFYSGDLRFIKQF